MELENSFENKSKYTRKPLNVSVPTLGDMQFSKNPFNKFFQPSNCTQRKVNCTINFHADNTLKASKSSRFYRSPTMPKPESIKIQENTGLLMEVEEGTDEEKCGWITESTKEEENILEELKACDYAATITPEVEHNFNIIQHLDEVDMDEIMMKFMKLNRKTENLKDKTLVLDLDDTLIHTINPFFNYPTMNSIYKEAKIVTYKNIETSELVKIHVLIRPHAIRLLKELSQLYEIVVFTAAQQYYADAVIDIIDSQRNYIAHRLYREACICKSNRYLKDLRIFEDRDLDKVVIVDNSIVSFANQLSNGIYVPSYFGQHNDNCLEKVLSLLKKIAYAQSIPKELENIVGLGKLYKEYIERQEGNEQ